MKNITNGVPQGSVLSPTLFNLYMHDLPPPPLCVALTSYAGDITITSTHKKTQTTVTQIQPYIDNLGKWLDLNQLRVAPTKSTATLRTSFTKEHQLIPQVYLNNQLIPHVHSTKILGVTYNTSLLFEPHISNIKKNCQPRLNALRAVTGSTFGQDKESCSTIYKLYIRSVMDYATLLAPDLSRTHHKTLQTNQNKALEIITGCTQTSPANHLHHETSILKFKDHLNMRVTQFLASAK